MHGFSSYFLATYSIGIIFLNTQGQGQKGAEETTDILHNSQEGGEQGHAEEHEERTRKGFHSVNLEVNHNSKTSDKIDMNVG